MENRDTWSEIVDHIISSFKLLKDGWKIGGDRAHPIESTNVIDQNPFIHPFVDCFVDEVRVCALIHSNSGSMKSFISQLYKRQLSLMIEN